MSETSVKYLKLPFLFDAHLLQADLEKALVQPWVPHFNRYGYEGEWDVIALLAKGGDASHIFALDNDERPLAPTQALLHCTYFKQVLEHFACEYSAARLMRLAPGAVIKPHRDHALGYEDGCFRIHIPIVTHPDIVFTLGGKQLRMEEGSCWYTNVNHEHSVANYSNVERVHLVIDGLRNAWSDALFFSLAPESHFFPTHPPKESENTIRRTIEELQNSTLPAAAGLIEQLKQRLKEMEATD